MINKHMKKYSTSLVTKEMQMKTTMRDHLIPTRMTVIRSEIISVDEDVEELEPSYVANGYVK